MELTRRVKVNGHQYDFLCQSRGTRSGFAHDCFLLRDGHEWSKASSYYLNRTWESYRFRTVMLNAIYRLIQERKNELEAKYRGEHEISRMTAKRKEEFLKSIEDDDVLKEYNEVYAEI